MNKMILSELVDNYIDNKYLIKKDLLYRLPRDILIEEFWSILLNERKKEHYFYLYMIKKGINFGFVQTKKLNHI